MSRHQWDIVEFTVLSGKVESYVGYITFAPPTGVLMGSNFLTSNEDWTIVGNKELSDAVFEKKSRGLLLSNYIYGFDDEIYLSDGVDVDLWYFNAPSKFLGNFGIAYGGSISFTLSSFSGNFATLNGDGVRYSLYSYLTLPFDRFILSFWNAVSALVLWVKE